VYAVALFAEQVLHGAFQGMDDGTVFDAGVLIPGKFENGNRIGNVPDG
jgi:hypothetical protein